MKTLLILAVLLSATAYSSDFQEELAADETLLMGAIRDCEEMKVVSDGKLANSAIPTTILKCMAPVDLEEEVLKETIVVNSESKQ
jgi:hypothetical protein